MAQAPYGGVTAYAVAPYTNEPSVLYNTKYRNNVIHVAQEKYDKLKGAVMEESGGVSEKVRFEFMGKSVAQVYTGGKHRILLPGSTFGSTLEGDDHHSTDSYTQRWCFPKKIWDAKLAGVNENIHSAIDIKGSKTTSMANAFARARTKYTFDAALVDPVWQGPDQDLSQKPFPASQIVPHADLGLTLAKVREAKFMLDDADVEDEDRYIGYCAEQLEQVLQWTETTSRDYSDLMMLKDGKIDTFMGFKWIRFSKDVLPCVTSGGTNIRYVPVWQKMGIGRCWWKQSVVAKVEQLQYGHYDWQFYMSENYNGIRIEDYRVVRIECVERLTTAREAKQALEA